MQSRYPCAITHLSRSLATRVQSPISHAVSLPLCNHPSLTQSRYPCAITHLSADLYVEVLPVTSDIPTWDFSLFYPVA
jgi:hypothetical protein